MIVIIFDQNSTASEVCAIEQERYSRPENFDILSHHYFHAVALEKNTVKSRKKTERWMKYDGNCMAYVDFEKENKN